MFEGQLEGRFENADGRVAYDNIHPIELMLQGYKRFRHALRIAHIGLDRQRFAPELANLSANRLCFFVAVMIENRDIASGVREL